MKCSCDKEYPIVLQFQFSDCSIVCSNCNQNVMLEGVPNSIHNDTGIWKEKYKNEYEKWLVSSQV